MRRIIRALVGLAVVGVAVSTWASPSGAATCEGIGALEVHGQHIVGDYVTGIGGISGDMEWPPKGGVVGQAIGGSGGADKPGQSGIHKHAPFAPGASFCVDSSSPGTHIGG